MKLRCLRCECPSPTVADKLTLVVSERVINFQNSFICGLGLKRVNDVDPIMTTKEAKDPAKETSDAIGKTAQTSVAQNQFVVVVSPIALARSTNDAHDPQR